MIDGFVSITTCFIVSYLFLLWYNWSLFYIIIIASFSHQLILVAFHWSLSDGKSPRVLRVLLSILAILNNVSDRMLSTLPLISNSSGSISKPLGTIPSAQTTIGITVTFMFHSFCSFFGKVQVLTYSFSFVFIQWSAGKAKSTRLQALLFLISSWSEFNEIRWSICIPKSQMIIIIIIIAVIVVVNPCEFFHTNVSWLAFTKRKQVSPHLQDFSQYSTMLHSK